MMTNNIKDSWVQLEADLPKKVSRIKLDSVPNLTCFVGSIQMTGARFFQIEVDNSIPIPKRILQRFSGLEIQILPSNGNSIQLLSIFLLERELRDIFTLFIEDIVEKLRVLTEVSRAIAVIHERIEYWKKLFAKVTGDILSSEKQRGLFGELHVLKLLLANAENKETILNSWIGPTNSNQDFARGFKAIEIKTSKAGAPMIHISNEHQLDFTQWQDLFLCLITVHETSGKEQTLNALIQEILSSLNPDWNLTQLFIKKLLLIGIEEEFFDQYDEINYEIRNMIFYRIDNGFPLIIPSLLNTKEVSNVKYQIDTRNCQAFEAEENEILKYFYGRNNN